MNGPLALAQVFDFNQRDIAIEQGQVAGGKNLVPGLPSVTAYGYIANHAGLANARCVGNIGYQPDADGVLRHIPAYARFGEKLYPSFAEVLVTCAERLPQTKTSRRQARPNYRSMGRGIGASLTDMRKSPTPLFLPQMCLMRLPRGRCLPGGMC